VHTHIKTLLTTTGTLVLFVVNSVELHLIAFKHISFGGISKNFMVTSDIKFVCQAKEDVSFTP